MTASKRVRAGTIRTGRVIFAALALIVQSSCRGAREPCPPGYYREGERCIDPADPIERYARCTERTAKQKLGDDRGSKVETTLNVLGQSATSLTDLRDKFDREVIPAPDRCVLLDISAGCYALASGNPKSAPDCVRATTSSSQPVASADNYDVSPGPPCNAALECDWPTVCSSNHKDAIGQPRCVRVWKPGADAPVQTWKNGDSCIKPTDPACPPPGICNPKFGDCAIPTVRETY
jgi:hypothetical protein